MKCRKCETEIEIKDVSVEFAAHNTTLLDIIITCPKCDHQINGFCDTTDMIDLKQ